MTPPPLPSEVFNASLRDPAGVLIPHQGRILRAISKAAASDLSSLLALKETQRLIPSGKLVATRVLSNDEVPPSLEHPRTGERLNGRDVGLVIEHERIDFPSYPYEWPPEMLYAAGALTLELAERFLSAGFGLKDASPYNVLFRGSTPVFVDLLSFERRDPRDPIWLAYGQFVRTFLLPLLVNKEFGIPVAALLLSRRDGLEPEEVYRICGPLQKMLPVFLTMVTLPCWFAARHDPDDPSIYRRRLLNDPQKGLFVFHSLLKRLRSLLAKVAPGARKKSHWGWYMSAEHPYAPDDFAAKHAFVERALHELKPRRVLDVGCNTGHFSALAAQSGASVVAIDSDPGVVGEVFRLARQEHLDILPLVINLGRPTPAVGWRNQECPSFLSRAREHFDAVLMLAIVHHLLVSEGVPLAEIADLAAVLTTGALVIEYVDPMDTMFRRLTRGREGLFTHLGQKEFQATFARHFDCLRCQHLGRTHRWMYLFRKQGSNAEA